MILREKVIVLSRKSAWRVPLRCIDRLILVRLYRLFLLILKPISVAQPGDCDPVVSARISGLVLMKTGSCPNG